MKYLEYVPDQKHADITDTSCIVLDNTHYLSMLSKLTSLKLPSSALTYTYVEKAARTLQRFHELHALSFRNMEIESEEFAFLVSHISPCAPLQSIEMYNARIYEVGLKTLMTHLRARSQPLKHLALCIGSDVSPTMQ